MKSFVVSALEFFFELDQEGVIFMTTDIESLRHLFVRRR
jgi:hypothetical protein